MRPSRRILLQLATVLVLTSSVGAGLGMENRSDELRPKPAAAVARCRTTLPRPESPAPFAQWRAHTDRDVAVYMLKHLQRACRRLDEFVRDHRALLEGSFVAERVTRVADELSAEALDPLYRAYPDLRDKDLTDAPAGATERSIGRMAKGAAGACTRSREAPPWHMTRTTADRLQRVLEKASEVFLKSTGDLADSVSPEKSEAFVQQILDISAEIGFATTPIYVSFPDLWQRVSRRSLELLPPRTAETDAEFRKQSPPPGTVKLSPSAVSHVRRFEASLRRERRDKDSILSIFWVLSSGWKGPNDDHWKKSGPGLQLGAHPRRLVPPDVIQKINGVKIIFSAPDPSIFVGKVIDFQNGKFLLRDP